VRTTCDAAALGRGFCKVVRVFVPTVPPHRASLCPYPASRILFASVYSSSWEGPRPCFAHVAHLGEADTASCKNIQASPPFRCVPRLGVPRCTTKPLGKYVFVIGSLSVYINIYIYIYLFINLFVPKSKIRHCGRNSTVN
jgi:hypothetical protein